MVQDLHSSHKKVKRTRPVKKGFAIANKKIMPFFN